LLGEVKAVSHAENAETAEKDKNENSQSVIPAKAGIQCTADSETLTAELDSRLRGNND